MKKFLLTLSISLFFILGVNAQSTANYQFATSTTGSLTDMTTSTTLLTGTGSSQASAVTNIGFNFYYMGTLYTQFSANSYGQIRLGGTSIGTGTIAPTSNAAYLVPLSGNNTLPTTGSVRCAVNSVTTGSITENVLTVDWSGLVIPSGTKSSQMQVRIHQTTGMIEYVYGTMYNDKTGSSLSASVYHSYVWSSTVTAGTIGCVTNITSTPTYSSTGTTPTNSSFTKASSSSTGIAMTNLNSSADGSRRIFTFSPPYTAVTAPTQTAITTPTPAGMTLNWTPISPNPSGYQILRSTDNITFTQVAFTANTASSYLASGLTDGTTYYWQVAALNEGAAPAPSNVSSQTTPLTPPTWATTAITSVTSASMTLNWIDNTVNETGYQIWMSTDGTNFSLVTTAVGGSGSGSTLTYTASLLNPLTTYYWKINAVNSNTSNLSTQTSIKSSTTTDVPPTAPTWAATPITALTTAGMTINWVDNSTTETGFQVYNSTDNNTFTLVTTTAANVTTYPATGLTEGTLYYWKVAAVNAGGSSAQTSENHLATPLIDPTWAAIPITAATSAGMTLNWNDNSSNESGYQIWMSTDGTNFSLLATTAANATSYPATGLNTVTTTYYWKINAVNVVSQSAQTSVMTIPFAPTWATTPITVVTSTGMTINWIDNSANETGFQIYQSTNNTTYTLITTTAANATSYPVTGLTEGTLYYWKVVAVNAGGASASTTENHLATPLIAPGWATTPITGATTTGMTLNWWDNSGNETGYEIWKSTDNITFSLVTTTAAGGSYGSMTYTASGLNPVTTYYWKIDAVNAVSQSAQTVVSSLSTIDTPPTAPTWTATPITSATGTGLTLNWNDLSNNETGFQIWNSTDNTWFYQVTTTAANATNYTASGLTPSTTYYWKIAAVNSGGASAFTSVMSIPIAPTWAATPITAVTGTTQTLNWVYTTGIQTGFNIYRSTDNITFTLITTTAATARTYAATGLTSGIAYNWKVTAMNAAGESAPISVGIPIAPTWAATAITAPTANLTANTTGLTLNWVDNSNNETGFQIEYNYNGGAFGILATVPANTTTYVASNITSVYTIAYRIAATSSGALSTYTTPSVSVPRYPTWAATPLTNITSTSVTLNWTDNATSEIGYHVYYTTDNVNFTLATTTAAGLGTGAMTYNATGLTSGTTYYWKVAAFSSDGESAATPLAGVPPAATWASPTLITSAGMTLNWINNALNLTGINIYRSTDNFASNNVKVTATPLAGTATSYVATGLAAGTNYYWKVEGVAVGGTTQSAASAAVSTLGSGNFTSIASGNWSAPATWSTGTVPTENDNVTISTGNTVTIDAFGEVAKTLSIDGTLTYSTTTTNAALTVFGNVTVNATGSFTSPVSGTITTQALTINTGNLVVNGVFDMNIFSTAGVPVTFSGGTSNTVSGTGTTINFFSLITNKSNSAYVLDIQSVITIAPASATYGVKLNAIGGTIKISSASVLSPFYGSNNINTSGTGISRIWLNNAGAVVQSVGAGTAGGANGFPTFGGILQIDAGTFSWGNGASTVGFSNGLTLGGASATFNMYGYLSVSNLIMTAGNINIYPQVGTNNSGANTAFSYSGTGITGGTITIVDPTTSGATSLAIFGTMTGNTIQFGNGTSDLDGSASGFVVNAGANILGNVIVNNAPSSVKTTRKVTFSANTFIGGNLTVNGGAANSLSLGSYALTLGGNLTNAGTISTGGVAANALTFNGSAQQIISNTGTIFTSIPTLTINNSSNAIPAVDLQIPMTVTNGLTLTNGQLGSSNSSILTLGNSAVSTSFAMGRSGGSLAALPTFALSGVTFNPTYTTAAASITTGFELPASINFGTFTVNNATGVVLDKPVGTTTLALTSGNLTSTSTNTITVKGPSPANITGGSTASYVKGPLTITIPTNAINANYKFPVGKTSYHLLEFAAISTAGTGTATFTGESFDAGPYAATAGTGLSAINTDKYWSLTGVLGTVTISSSTVRLNDTGLTAVNKFTQSDNASGTYNTLGATVTGGTTIASVNPVSYANLAAGTYFRVGTATVISAGTYAIGPNGPYGGYTGTYAKFSDAVNAITSAPLTGNIIFEFQPDYVPSVETYPIALTPSILSNATNTITFRPAATVASVINFSGTTSILTNTGADYIIFDGRNGGTGTNKFLQFTSSSTTAGTIVLSGDAQYNQILYSTVKGSTTTALTGLLTVNTPTSGNNFLTVDHCNFDGSGTANNCLYIASTASTASDATITNNNFYDFRIGSGLYLASAVNNALIDGNSFYQTTAYNAIAGTTTAINVTGGNNVIIRNNNIGGNASGLTGIWTVNSAAVVYNFTGINATTLATTSKIYNNKIQNFDWKSNTSTWTGITVSGSVNVGTDGANYIGNNTGNDNIKVTDFIAGANTINGITVSGTPVIENNIIGSITTLLNTGITSAGTTFYGINSSGTGLINSNIIGSATVANSVNLAAQSATGSTQSIYGIYLTGNATIQNNVIGNLTNGSTVATGVTNGISATNIGPITLNNVHSLTTYQPVTGTGLLSSLNGINQTSNGTLNITSNTVYDLVNTSAAAVTVNGIVYTSTTLTGNIVAKNLIHSFKTTSNNAIQNGLNMVGGISNVQNNAIRLGIDASGTSVTSTAQINGILKTTATYYVNGLTYTGCNFYFNTVYIGGTGVVSGVVKTYAMNYAGLTYGSEVMNNNIFANMRTGSGGAINYALLLPVKTLLFGNYSLTSDYNIYGVAPTSGMLFNLGGVDYSAGANLQSYTVADLHSGFGNPLLANPTAAAATLDLQPAAATEVEGMGIAIASVTDDISGALRSSNTPTDIGAYSGNYAYPVASLDIFSPVITYTNLGSGTSTVSRLAGNISITDPAGAINVTAGTKPRLYYKLSTNTNAFGANTSAFNGWKWVESNGTTSPFDFTIDYSLLNGTVVVGNTIQYFVVAQNQATIPAVVVNPSAGATATSVASVSVAPTTPNSYTIIPGITIPASVNVGTGQTYTSLTGTLASGGLFAAFNEGGSIGANTVINITSDITEPGTTKLSLVNETGSNQGSLTLTIQSDGTAHVISGAVAGAPMISINGAKRVTIDGGASKLLTFRNSGAGAGAVIQFDNNSQNDIMQNCIIESNIGAIVYQYPNYLPNGGAVQVGSTGTNSVTINQNDIRDSRGGTLGMPTTGIYSNSALNALTITNNNIYNFGSAVASYTTCGIYLQNATTTSSITGNSLYTESSVNPASLWTGIYLNNGSITNVSGNYIGGSAPTCGGSALTLTNASTFTGFYTSPGAAGITLQNNTIQNISLASATVNPTFYGFNNYLGPINIIGNTIGSATTPNSIQIGGSGTSAGVIQTYISGANPAVYDKNTIANITLSGSYPNFSGLKINGGLIRKNKIFNIGSSSASTVPYIYGIYSSSGGSGTEFSNNAISLNGGASTAPTALIGINDLSGGTTGVYYNSINISGTATSSAPSTAFYGSGAIYTAKDNVFVNARTGGTGVHTAFSVPTTFTSNYNDLYVAGSTLGIANGVSKANLAAWQAGSQDANSISTDPLFTSPSNLIPQTGSPLLGLGTTVSGITTDITEATRSLTYPTLGAYEVAFTCTNPTLGGTIAGDQSNCTAYTPATITSVAIPSGNVGILNYKWQMSTTSSTTGFVDIPNSNTINYSPAAITQTTWFKRVARVACMADWTGAVESNVATTAVVVASASVSIVSDVNNVCAGTSVTFTATPSNVGSTPTSYQWYKNSQPISSATSTSYTYIPLNGDVISVNLTSSTVCSTTLVSPSNTVTMVINPLPTAIFSGPASVCIGSGVQLSINLTGTQPWSVTYTNGTTPVTVTGITTSPYQFTVSPVVNTTYIVTSVSDGHTCSNSATSSALVTVNPLPTAAITGSATVCQGTNVPLSVALTGTQPWSVTYTDGTTPVTVTGIAASPYVFNVTPATTTTYTVTNVSDANTCSNTTTSSATVTVNPLPVVTTPNTASTCNGTSPNISLTSSVPASFSWVLGTVSGVTGASAGLGTTINQTLTNASNSTAGTVEYIVTPTSTTGTCQGAAYTITVTVNPTPVVTNTNAVNICNVTSPNITLTASTASNFAWTLGTVNGVTGASAGSGASINQVLTNTSSTAAGTVEYIVTATSQSGSCASAPYTITVTVNPTVTNASVSILESQNNICLGNSVTFTPTPINEYLPVYTWYVNGVSVGTGATYTSTALINGDVVYAVMSSSVACVNSNATGTFESNHVTMIAKALADVTTPNTASICNGTSVGISLTSTNASTYMWTIGTITGGITGVNSGTGTSISDVLTNPSNASAGTVQYLVTPTITATGCVGLPYTITITVNPTPAVTNPPTATACNGFSPDIVLSASTPSTFTWTVGTITGNITGATESIDGTGTTIIDALTNTDLVPGTVVYLVTATSTTGSCNSVTYPITVTVMPTVSVIPSVTIVADHTSLCAGVTTPVTFTAIPADEYLPVYQWYLNGAPVVGATGNTYTNSALNDLDWVYVEMTSAISCINDQVGVTILSNTISMSVATPPTADIWLLNYTASCPGSSVPLEVDVTGTGPWTVTYSVDDGVNPVTQVDALITDADIAALGYYTLNVTPTLPTTYTILNVVDANCSNTVSLYSGSVVVDVSPGPDVTLTVGGTGNVCTGTGTDITVDLSDPNCDYQLRDAANHLIGTPVQGDGTNILLPTGNLTTSTTFNVLATDVTTGCTAQLAQTADVTVIASPAAAGAITGSTILTPGTTAVPYSVGTIANATSYLWTYTGTGVIINGTGTSVTLDFAANATAGQLKVQGVNACVGVESVINISPGSQLSLKVFLQGLYNSTNGNMNQCQDYVGGVIVNKFAGTIADTITVELHDPVTYSTLVYKATGIELNQNGICNSTGLPYILIPANYSGSYYVTIKTRNHIETTTFAPVSFASNIANYDFTTAATQAFGSNIMMLTTGVYGLYVGDVNRDGLVNVTDLSLALTQIKNGVVGYNDNDVNGDGMVNVTDYSVILTSLKNGVSKINP